MKMTLDDFNYLWITGSRWAGCKGTEYWIDDGAYVSIDEKPIRRDFKSHFIFGDYASVLWARKYLEQEGFEYQVLSNEYDQDGDMGWSIITDLSLGEMYDNKPCECKFCKGVLKKLDLNSTKLDSMTKETGGDKNS